MFERETKRTVCQWWAVMRVGAAVYGRCHAAGRALCTLQGGRCSGCIRGRAVPLCGALEREALEPPKIVEDRPSATVRRCGKGSVGAAKDSPMDALPTNRT